jgi:hypothetical protein
MPAFGGLSQLNQFIQELPTLSSPEVVGLHPNAAISCDQSETERILAALLAVEPRQYSKVASMDESSPESICTELLTQVGLHIFSSYHPKLCTRHLCHVQYIARSIHV